MESNYRRDWRASKDMQVELSELRFRVKPHSQHGSIAFSAPHRPKERTGTPVMTPSAPPGWWKTFTRHLEVGRLDGPSKRGRPSYDPFPLEPSLEQPQRVGPATGGQASAPYPPHVSLTPREASSSRFPLTFTFDSSGRSKGAICPFPAPRFTGFGTKRTRGHWNCGRGRTAGQMSGSNDRHSFVGQMVHKLCQVEVGQLAVQVDADEREFTVDPELVPKMA